MMNICLRRVDETSIFLSATHYDMTPVNFRVHRMLLIQMLLILIIFFGVLQTLKMKEKLEDPLTARLCITLLVISIS